MAAWLSRQAGSISAQQTADTAKDVPSTGAKCSSAASFPARISPLTEQQEEGRDLSGEQETEMKASVCSSHSSSKVKPSQQLLPAQASPELKSFPKEDSQSQPCLLNTEFLLLLFSKSTNDSMLEAWRRDFGSCTRLQCVRGAGQNQDGVWGGPFMGTCSKVGLSVQALVSSLAFISSALVP